MFDNPDSWEGWHWDRFMPTVLLETGLSGAVRSPGRRHEKLRAFRLLVMRPGLHTGGYAGRNPRSGARGSENWAKKMVFIDPSAIIRRPAWRTSGSPPAGTDAALAEAIAYVWLDEDTYDKTFVEEHTLGFETFKNYILGKEDGVKKTPRRPRRSPG